MNDDRIPVKVTEATYADKGFEIRGTITHEQAAQLGLTGNANVSGLSVVNRWAAFTDAELDVIGQAINDHDAWLSSEITSELERRKT